MTRAPIRVALAATAISRGTVTPALAQAGKIDGADTAWMISATGLVLLMTIPGLALFYAGMVRKKNVLATMAQSSRRYLHRLHSVGMRRLFAHVHRRRRFYRFA